MARRESFSRFIPSHQPLVFLAAAFISGLLASSAREAGPGIWVAAASVLWAASCLSAAIDRVWSVIRLAVTLGVFFALGGALWSIERAARGDGSVGSLISRGIIEPGEPVELRGTLFLAPEPAPDRIYLHIAVEGVETLGRAWRANGNVQVLVPFNDPESRVEYDALGLDYGARIRLICQIDSRRGYRNPGAPDFREIMEARGYDARGWVKSPLLIEVLGRGEGRFLLARLYRLRARMVEATLTTFNQPSKGILAASLFGNRYFLPRGTAEAFRVEGTFHLLVISGMHVAMIAAIALWLSRFVSRSRTVRYLLAGAVVWVYALMIGYQPSIMRSAIMMTVLIAGRLFFRSSAGANILSASALLQLALRPGDILDSGFQLSFLTVLVIVSMVVPLFSRLRKMGQWRPTSRAPFPPRAPSPVLALAETIFWDEAGFRREMEESRIRYRLFKSRLAASAGRLRLQGVMLWVGTTLLTTVCVQTALLPIMVARFHRFSIVSPLANLIEEVLVSLLMLAGAIYLGALAALGVRLAWVAAAADAIGRLIASESGYLTSIESASVRVPDPGSLAVEAYAGFFLAVAVLAWLLNEWNPFEIDRDQRAARRRRAGAALASASAALLLALGSLIVTHPFPHSYESGRLSLTFLDVGQGDSILITFPDGRLMMVDSGGRPDYGRFDEDAGGRDFIEDRIGVAEAAVMPYLWSRGIRRLDWIVATHGDADHIQAFEEIAANFRVGTAFKPASLRTESARSVFERPMESLNVRTAARGESLEAGGARVDFIWPPDAGASPAGSDNNLSLVLSVSYGGRRFLLCGDIEKEAEAALLDSAADLRADVLKVSHHGSRTSSSPEFLSAVRPAHSVVSVAEPSPYGHPHPEVIDRLEKSGSIIWRTSSCGAVTFSTDGSDLRVSTFAPCSRFPQQ